jgi:hypothetical protein
MDAAMNPTQITANSLPARAAPARIKELEVVAFRHYGLVA